MAKHEEKYCPRCRARFECKVGSIMLCQCSTVQLTTAQREYINTHYTACLCASCMRELRTVHNVKQHNENLKQILGNHFKENK